MLNEIKAGSRVLSDGTTGEARAGSRSEAIVSMVGGKYYEAASRGKLFIAASQAEDTWSVALHQTHLGLVISNPRNSTVNLIMCRASFGYGTAPVAVAPITLFQGFDADAEVAHTNAITIYNCLIGGSHGVANADDSATLPTAPTNLETIWGGFTAGALPDSSPAIVDLDGAWIVPPGGYVGISALTAALGLGSLMWEEIEI